MPKKQSGRGKKTEPRARSKAQSVRRKTSSEWLSVIKQWMQCREFRIAMNDVTDRPPAKVEQAPPELLPQPSQPPSEAVSDALLATLAEVATCLWDIERKIRPDARGEIPMKQKMAHRKAQRGLLKLKEAGMELEDLAGQPYAPGQNLKVHLQPTPGTTVEMITETVYPTIRWKNLKWPIQVGEVWVAVPPMETTHGEETAAAEPPASAPGPVSEPRQAAEPARNSNQPANAKSTSKNQKE